MIIRKPTEDELLSLLPLGKAMWSESDYFATKEFDEEAVMAFGHSIYNNPDVFIRIARKDEESPIMGMFVGFLVPYFFAPKQKMAVDQILFVSPEHRGGSTAPRLLKSFSDWAEASGALEARLGVSTGVHPERTGKLYERMGFAHLGGIYAKRF